MTIRLFAALAMLAFALSPAWGKPKDTRQAAQQTEPKAKEAPKKKLRPIPYRTEILNFSNWTVICRSFHKGPRKHVCSARLKVTKSGSRQELLEWAIELNARNEPYAVIKTFTDVLIKPGVSLQLGKSERKLPFTSCFSSFCIAASPFDSKFAQEIEAAPIAEVTTKTADGRTLKIKFPTTGFNAAYKALRH